MNQTEQLTPPLAQKTLGNRLKQFAAARKKYDPQNRLLNSYYQGMLAE